MISGAIAPIDIDVQAIIAAELSPQAQSASLAAAARGALAEAEASNARALGFVPAHTTVVDGVAGLDEARVRPDGEIVYTFDLHADVLDWIITALREFAPVLSGRFRQSFALVVDGVLADLERELPEGRQFVFMSPLPYAGKIEGENRAPESDKAPDGVFEAVAALARQRFPGVDISFGYIVPPAGSGSTRPDTPAITLLAGA